MQSASTGCWAEMLPADKKGEIERLQGAAMAFSSVNVVSNSLRLRRFGRRAPTDPR